MKIRKEEALRAFDDLKWLQELEDKIFKYVIFKLEIDDESGTKDWLFDFLYNNETPDALLNFLAENKFLED
jgi:hypothetical protein